MQKGFRHYIKVLGLLLPAVILFTGCVDDGNSGSVRAVINNVQVEVDVQDVRCFSDFDPNQVNCIISLRTPGFFADYIRFDIFDIPTIFNDSMGQWIEVNTNLVAAEMTFNSNNAGVLPGSVIRFTRLTNAQNGDICAQYQLNIGFGSGFVDGEFCGQLNQGF